MSGSYDSSHGRPTLGPESVNLLYNRSIPQSLAATYGQAGNVANSLAGAAYSANPIYTASGQQQLQQFAPGYQQAGIDAATRQAGASADLIGGEGARTAFNADALNRSVNPNYYSTSSNVAQAGNDLLQSFGRGATLGGGEMAAAERAINQGNTQSGNLGNVNAYNTIGNALNFGEYARQKQQMLGNAIGQVNQTLPNMVNPTFNPVSTALGAGNVAGNFGLAQYNPMQANANLNAPAQFGSSVYGGMTQGGAAGQTESKGTKAGVADCCFIFMEAYGNKLPWTVRHCRDRYYCKFPAIARGYKMTAKWLVPLMHHHVFIREFVWKHMVYPLTQYGKFVTRQDLSNRKYKSYRKFWFTVWNFMGR